MFETQHWISPRENIWRMMWNTHGLVICVLLSANWGKSEYKFQMNIYVKFSSSYRVVWKIIELLNCIIYSSFIWFGLKSKFIRSVLELVHRIDTTFSEKYWSPLSTVILVTFSNLPVFSAALPKTETGWQLSLTSLSKVTFLHESLKMDFFGDIWWHNPKEKHAEVVHFSIQK